MIKKSSKQRDAIIQSVKNRRDHPTADEIYAQLRESYPNISLGTVYRNLAQLSEAGFITRISCIEGADRFDGDTSSHYHFQCTSCKKILDVEMDVDTNLNAKVEKLLDAHVDDHMAMFYGTCRNCKGLAQM